ncbi:MAG TPA: MFS transporter [Firmicutes bacterium]|nr:MFS transporter [Bacillota bacterium]
MGTNLAFGMTNPFMQVYALALGASSFMVNMVSALPALVNVFSFALGPRWIEGEERKLPAVMKWAIGHRIFYALMALVPFLPAWRAEALVLLFSMSSFPNAMSGIAWTAMMGHVFPPGKRSEVFARRNGYVGFAGIAGTLVAGYLLDWIEFPLNYVVVFLVAFLGSVVGLHYLRMTIELGGTARRGPARGFVEMARAVMRDKEFGRQFKYFSLSCTALWFGFGFTAASWAIYHVTVLHLPNKIIGMFGVVNGLAMVLFYPYWGALATVKGERWVLLICMAGLTIFPTLYTLWPSAMYLGVLQLVSGACTGGLNFAIFNLLLGYARPEERANAAGIFNAMVNAAAFVAPFLGNIWYENYGVISTFHACTMIRFASLVLLWKIMETELPGTRVLKKLVAAGPRTVRGRFRT